MKIHDVVSGSTFSSRSTLLNKKGCKRFSPFTSLAKPAKKTSLLKAATVREHNNKTELFSSAKPMKRLLEDMISVEESMKNGFSVFHHSKQLQQSLIDPERVKEYLTKV